MSWGVGAGWGGGSRLSVQFNFNQIQMLELFLAVSTVP